MANELLYVLGTFNPQSGWRSGRVFYDNSVYEGTHASSCNECDVVVNCLSAAFRICHVRRGAGMTSYIADLGMLKKIE